MIIEDSTLEYEINNSLFTRFKSIEEHKDIVRNMTIYFAKHTKFLNPKKLNYLFYLTDVEHYTDISEAFILSGLKYFATDKGPMAYSLITEKELFEEVKDLFIEKESPMCIIERKECKMHPCMDEDTCHAKKEHFLFLKPGTEFYDGEFSQCDINNLAYISFKYRHMSSESMLEYLKCDKHAWYPAFLESPNQRISFKYYERNMSEAQLSDRNHIREMSEHSMNAFSKLFENIYYTKI